MKPTSGKKFIKLIKKIGWKLDRISGSHHIYVREGTNDILSIPVHSNEDIPVGTFQELYKRSGLKELESNTKKRKKS